MTTITTLPAKFSSDWHTTSSYAYPTAGALIGRAYTLHTANQDKAELPSAALYDA